MSNDYGIIHYFYKQFGKLDFKKFLWILGFIVFSSWLADGLFQIILFLFSLISKQIKIENVFLSLIQFFISSYFFIYLYFLLRKHLNKLDKIKYTVKKVNPKGIKALVLFLSKPNFDPQKLNNIINSIKDFEKDEMKNTKINWEIPVLIISKIIHELKNDLKIVYVILSKESNEYFDIFKNFVKKLINNDLKQDLEILSLEEIVDFENLENTIEAIDRAYSYLNSKGLKNNEIIIDITGGQKIQSTAGGFYASSYDRYFCYLSTNTKELLIFDVIYNFE